MLYFLCRFPFHLLILSPLPLPPWTDDWRVFLGWLIGFPPPRQRDIMTPASLAISRQTRTYIRSKTPGLSLSLLLIYETNLSFTLLSSTIFAYIFSLWNRRNGAPPDKDGTCWPWMDSEALSPRRLSSIFPGPFPPLLLPSYVMVSEDSSTKFLAFWLRQATPFRGGTVGRATRWRHWR